MSKTSSPNIFLSSTYLDLINERKVACNAIIKDYSIIRMEDWSSEDITSKEKILKELKRAAAVVFILGFEYGTIDEEEGISLTEFEFNTAKKLNIPVYSFIKKENGKWKNQESDSIKYEKLNKFKSKIDKYLRKSFESSDELKSLILKSLNDNKDEIWYNKTFNDDFFRNNVEKSIEDLDNRYNNELNVELGLEYLIDSLSLNDAFKNKFKNEFINCFCSLKKLKVNNFIFKEKFPEELHNLHLEFEKILENNFNNLDNLCFLINNIIDILNNYENRFEDNYSKNKLFYIIKNFENFLDKLNGIEYKLCSNPFLLLKGKAGIGKSHFLADISLKRIKNSEMTLLFLGSYFKNEDIGLQIINHLNSKLDYDDFLYELNQKAKIRKSRIIIIIDAVNECEYKDLWKNRLNGFVSELKKFEWLGLIISIRTTYSDILPQKNNFLEYEHKGFGYNIMKALKKFSSIKKVNFPSCPVLNHEFSNPLILKILFDIISKNNTEFPQEGINFSELVNDYILFIDKAIHSKFNLPRGLNIVDDFIEKFIMCKLNNGIVSYKEALRFGIEILEHNHYILIDALIEEDLFIEINDNVFFTYEKIGDYLIAQYLLNDISLVEIPNLFKDGGLIYNFINNNVSDYSGILESFAFILPENFDIEIYEINFDDFDDFDFINRLLPYWFIESLYWRNPDSISENVINYIKNEIIPFEERFDKFMDAMILLSYNPNFILNAKKLHECLFNKPLNERDSIWTTWIHNKYNENDSVYRFVNWIFTLEDIEKISHESLNLIIITLSWFLTSTNNELRDNSTYALIYLLKDNIDSLIDLLKHFEGVNDLYIYERLFAVAYGVALRNNNFEDIKYLVEYVYDEIFFKDNDYVHILLRDYARGIIEYGKHLKEDLEIDESKLWLNPSKNIFEVPTDEELNKINNIVFNDEIDGYNYIYHSMNLKSGDFGRYVFDSSFHYWKDEINIENLQKIALKNVFDLYDINLHGKFDNLEFKHSWNRYYSKTERIGKKYQWIVFYNMLGVISEKYKLKNSWNDDTEHYMVGAWEVDARNFDPSINFKNNIVKTDYIMDKFDIISHNENWSETIDDLINIKDLIIQNILDDEWLSLYSQINWNNKNDLNFNCYFDKSFFIDCNCIIVKKEDKNTILSKLQYEKMSDIYLNRNRLYQVFDREYSWSKSFYDLTYEEDFQYIIYKNYDKYEKVHLPFDENVYEFNPKMGYVDFNNFKPSKLLFDNLNLKYGEKDNILYSNIYEPVVINLSNSGEFIYQILIKKDKFISFLNDNNFDVIWLVSGKKLSYVDGSRNFEKDLYLNGIYQLINEEISGKLNHNHYSHNYIATKETNKVHLNSCEFVEDLCEKYCLGFDTIKDALNEGFNLCSKCMSNFNEE